MPHTAFMLLEVAQVVVAIGGLSVGAVLAWRSHVRYARIAPVLGITNGRLALLRTLAFTDITLVVTHLALLYLAVRSYGEQGRGLEMTTLWDMPLARTIANFALLCAQWRRYRDRQLFLPWPIARGPHDVSDLHQSPHP